MFFIAPDADGVVTLWRHHPARPDRPEELVSQSDVRPDVWRLIVMGLVARDLGSVWRGSNPSHGSFRGAGSALRHTFLLRLTECRCGLPLTHLNTDIPSELCLGGTESEGKSK